MVDDLVDVDVVVVVGGEMEVEDCVVVDVVVVVGGRGGG